MDVSEESKARRYRVSSYRKGYPSGGCVTVRTVVWAYSAADAQHQVELMMKGTIPPDPYFRVTDIEPVDCVRPKKPGSDS